MATSAEFGDNLLDCPSMEELIDFRKGTLTEERRSAVVSHLASCDSCDDFVEMLDPERINIEHVPAGSGSEVLERATHLVRQILSGDPGQP